MKKTPLMLLFLLLVSILFRLITGIILGTDVNPVSGAYDQVTYDHLARRVALGYGFSFGENWWPLTRAGEPTAHWSFLYTSLLAGFYFLFGDNPLYPRLVQGLTAGILHPLLVWWISRRLFGLRAALWSVAITAFYSYFIFYSATLMTESFFIIGILLLFQISIGFSMEGAAELLSSRKVWYLKWIALGGTLGICALLRQHIILFAPVLVAWIAWTFLTRQMKESDADSSVGNRLAVKRLSVGILLCLLVFCTMIFPWTLRNYLRFEEFVLLNTNAGFAIFWGNHPIHGTDFIPILPEKGPSYQELVPSDWQSLNEAALEKKLFRSGIGFIFDDPVRFAWLCLGRAREIFKFWPTDESSTAANLARVLSFGICLPFIMAGLGRYFSVYRGQTFRHFITSPGFLMILFVLFHIGVHLLSWGLIRYRLPADAVLIIFAGFGITLLAKERKELS